MAKKRQSNLVTEQDGLIWLALHLAAKKTGLTKPELARRALSKKLRYLDDKYGNPIWLAEEDINPLRIEYLERTSKAHNKAKKPRKKTAAQLEREWKKISEERPVNVHYGPVSRHHDKVMLTNLNKQKKPQE